jgi:hypothetical protein
MKLQLSPDGTILEFLKNGSKRQTKGSGDSLVTLADGTLIQRDAGSSITLTTSPGGYMLQTDSNTGVKIHKYVYSPLIFLFLQEFLILKSAF